MNKAPKTSFHRLLRRVCLAGLALVLSIRADAEIADNVRFSGFLVAQPCDIASNSENILVEMQTILTNDLYHGRTSTTPFSIDLINCDPAVAKTVYAKFVGQESSELQGLMLIPASIPSSNTGSGIAIGLELLDGAQVFFNKKTDVHTLTSGKNQILLKAFVQAEPSSIVARSIQLGLFHAISTFHLDYQ